LDLKELKEILQILDEKEITEFELEQDGVKLRIRKASSTNHSPAGGPAVMAPLHPMVLSGQPALAPGTAPPLAAAAPIASAAAAPVPAPEPDDATVVKSPIVGTFYRSPDPNSPAFVSVGDKVRVGQVLCIIEAMKLMNEIEAEVAGEVVKIHRDNGQPVQYGDPLFTIRQDR
jgi:acetyl-CoA carboxylase biotin carboxyl carrier protein